MSDGSIKITDAGIKTVERRDKTGVSKSKIKEDSFGAVLSSALGQLDEVQRTSTGVLNSVTPDMCVAGPPATPSEADFKSILNIVMKHEGTGYVKKDGGRESSKMGILQATAREYGYKGDIKNITKAEAQAIYKKIWDKSGAAKLPYPLSVVHFDTYVNSPAAAKRILKQSGGDIDKYLNMREQRFVRLAAMRPNVYRKYLKGWINRVNDLRIVASQYARAGEAARMETASAKTIDTRA
ncbi:MAG TPA: glycosyl hydrolase 108 family protein [Thermodesulfovibrionales bacterium]|nr:glycosyl hydrolase 108 family protein [Thermodesulfovibrionales bacterium]